MKQRISYLLITLFLSHQTLAMNPPSGWYAGIVLGGSYAPNADIIFVPPITPLDGSCSSSATCGPSIEGSLSYSGYGNIGGQIGFRYDKFRAEVEPVVNYNPYNSIIVDNIEYPSPDSSSGLRLKGGTTTALLMVNALYDFYTRQSGSNFAPYIGAGIGYAYVKNDIDFYCNNQKIACTHLSESQNTAAIQGIGGIAYYMDDFTWFGLDYRYITTNTINMLDSRVQVHTINLSFNGMFNCL